MRPVLLSRFRPSGSGPADSENVKGAVPPVVATDWLYAWFSLPLGSDVVLTASAALTVRLSPATVLSLLLPSSCKVMPSGKVPATAGVPLIVSVVPDRDAVKPPGKPVTYRAL